MLLGILNSQAAGAAISYWLATLGGTGIDIANSVSVDSSGNSYVAGQTASAGAGSRDFLFAKYDSSGTIQWQRTLGGSGYDQSYGVANDSAGNLYITGNTDSDGEGSSDLLLAKYNSSGVIQWQRTLGSTGTEFSRSIAVDSSDNIYIAGESDPTGANDGALLAKYNSSGAIQWQRTLSGDANDQWQQVKVDASGNVYVVGDTRSGGEGGDEILLAKYNSSGTIQWQRLLGLGGNDGASGVSFDSSGNVYVAAYAAQAGTGETDAILVKYNSSGTIQWQRALGGNSFDRGKGVAVDSLDNVYLLAEASSDGEGGEDYLIAKYNSSGTIQWQRTLGDNANESPTGIAIDSNDNLFLIGTSLSTDYRYFLLAKLPSDGSLTGTYTIGGADMVYAASALTDEASSLTAATPSFTAATSSLTDASSSLTDASSSLTTHFVEIPT